MRNEQLINHIIEKNLLSATEVDELSSKQRELLKEANLQEKIKKSLISSRALAAVLWIEDELAPLVVRTRSVLDCIAQEVLTIEHVKLFNRACLWNWVLDTRIAIAILHNNYVDMEGWEKLVSRHLLNKDLHNFEVALSRGLIKAEHLAYISQPEACHFMDDNDGIIELLRSGKFDPEFFSISSEPEVRQVLKDNNVHNLIMSGHFTPGSALVGYRNGTLTSLIAYPRIALIAKSGIMPLEELFGMSLELIEALDNYWVNALFIAGALTEEEVRSLLPSIREISETASLMSPQSGFQYQMLQRLMLNRSIILNPHGQRLLQTERAKIIPNNPLIHGKIIEQFKRNPCALQHLCSSEQLFQHLIAEVPDCREIALMSALSSLANVLKYIKSGFRQLNKLLEPQLPEFDEAMRRVLTANNEIELIAARQAVIAELHIKRNARLLMQGKRSTESWISVLPTELLEIVALHAVPESSSMDRNQRYMLANKYVSLFTPPDPRRRSREIQNPVINTLVNN